MGHHGIGANYAVLSKRDARLDAGTVSNERILLDKDVAFTDKFLLHNRSQFRVKPVRCIRDVNSLPKYAPVFNHYLRNAGNPDIPADMDIVANDNPRLIVDTGPELDGAEPAMSKDMGVISNRNISCPIYPAGPKKN